MGRYQFSRHQSGYGTSGSLSRHVESEPRRGGANQNGRYQLQGIMYTASPPGRHRLEPV
jgi:hypothetical protein